MEDHISWTSSNISTFFPDTESKQYVGEYNMVRVKKNQDVAHTLVYKPKKNELVETEKKVDKIIKNPK